MLLIEEKKKATKTSFNCKLWQSVYLIPEEQKANEWSQYDRRKYKREYGICLRGWGCEGMSNRFSRVKINILIVDWFIIFFTQNKSKNELWSWNQNMYQWVLYAWLQGVNFVFHRFGSKNATLEACFKISTNVAFWMAHGFPYQEG